MELQPQILNEESAPDQVDINEPNKNQQQIEGFMSNTQAKTYRSFLALLARVVNLCLGSFFFGYGLAYFGTFKFQAIVNIFGIQGNIQTIQGLLQGCIPVGGGIGALGSSLVLKRFSRRNSLIFVNLIAFFINILILIPNFKILFVARFLQGICVGVYSAIIPLLIKQYTPNQLSGTFGALNQTFIAFGVFFSYTFQWILVQFSPQQEHWRTVFGLPLITIGIQTLCLLLLFNEQTPKYLLQNNQQEKCLKYLQKVYLPEYVESIMEEKKKDLQSIRVQQQKKLMERNQNGGSMKMDKGKKLRILVAIHLAVLQQMVGINSVIAYGTEIAQQTMKSLTRMIPVLLNGLQIVATIVSSYLLSKQGRVIILNIGTLVSALSLSLIATGFIFKNSTQTFSTSLIMLGLFVYMFNFGISLGPVVWLYIAEIVQPQIIPFSTLSNWAAASVVVILFPILKQAFGTPVPLFFFFAVWSSLSVALNKQVLIETKDKSQKQIHQQFSNK